MNVALWPSIRSIVRIPSCEFHRADSLKQILLSRFFHWADSSIEQIPSRRFHRADSSMVQIPICRFHYVDSIIPLCGDSLMQIPYCVGSIVRIPSCMCIPPSAYHCVHSIVYIPLYVFHPSCAFRYVNCIVRYVDGGKDREIRTGLVTWAHRIPICMYLYRCRHQRRCINPECIG